MEKIHLKEYGTGAQTPTLKVGDCLERREQIRFQIRAVVNFEWLDGEGVTRRGRGLTRDISAKGLFIFSDSYPPTKADLRVDVLFGSISGADTNLRLRAQTVVLRVDAASKIGAHTGFAVLNRSHKLANQDSIEDLEAEHLNNGEPN